MRLATPMASIAAFALIALTTPATSHAQIMISPAPMQEMYVSPAPTVVTRSYAVRTPIGPTAYVAPAPMAYRAYPRRVVTTTTVVPTTTYVPRTTYVPTTTYAPATSRAYVTDPMVSPVGYEVIRPNGRVKTVYPRQVYRYGY